MLTIFLIFGLSLFLSFLGQKFNVLNKLDELASKSRYKVFYDLIQCKLCRVFWLVLLCCLLVFVIPAFILVPFVITGYYLQIDK